MSNRHPSNPNLVLHSENTWQGLPVYTGRGSLVVRYLERIHRVMQLATNEYPRTAAFRFDLRFPTDWDEPDTATISRFLESLKAQLSAHETRKERAGTRIHESTLRYVWVKEWDRSNHWHYHVCIFTNYDAYFTLGLIKPLRQRDGRPSILAEVSSKRNMADRLRQAWASALGADVEDTGGLVNFPDKSVYHLYAGTPMFRVEFKELFKRLSYFAKAETKRYGDGSNWFGCSRG